MNIYKKHVSRGKGRRSLCAGLIFLFLNVGGMVGCNAGDDGGDEILSLLLLAGPGIAGQGAAAPGSGTQVTLAGSLSANLNTAISLVVAPAGAATKGPITSRAGDSLYVLNSDNSLSELSLSEEGGASIVPASVFNTRTFILLRFNGAPLSHQGVGCNYVAARKSDSRLFCVNNFAPSYLQNGSLKANGTGDLIYIYGSGSINRLDFSNPDSPVQQTVLSHATDGHIDDFFVNHDGDLMVDMRSSSAAYRIYQLSGAIKPFSATPGFYSKATRGPTNFGNYFYASNGNGVPIYRIDKEGVQSIYYQDSTPPYFERQACVNHMYRTDARIECMKLLPSNDRADFVTMLTSAGAPMGSLSTISPIAAGAVTETHYFDGGMVANTNLGIARYKRSPLGETILLSSANYGISNLKVSETGAITFYGRRFSDGAFVLGSIPANSNTPTIATTNIGEPSAILPIN